LIAASGFRGSTKQVKLVKKLLYLGADLEAIDVHRGTALQHAIYANIQAVVHDLLDAGAMINVDCGEFGNPLQTAVSKGTS
jgi:ankyrin repeat protein